MSPVAGVEDISRRKKEIEDRLTQEQKNLAFLRESLHKSNQLTQNMLNILSSFESRLHKLEDTIVPVHKETGDLQRRQANIERTVHCLDHVINYHHVASNVDPVVKDGPSNNLEVYLKSMDRVLDAIDFFNQNNPNSPELSLLNSLYEQGRDYLEKEFRTQLGRHSKVVTPEFILQVLNAEEAKKHAKSKNADKETCNIEHLPEHAVHELGIISHWLVGPGQTVDFMSIYSKIRSSNLSKSLKGLTDAQIQGSVGVYSHAPLIKGKPGAGPSTPARKSTARRKELRKAPSKQFTEGFYASSGITRKGSHNPNTIYESPVVKDEVDEIDAGKYITYCGALLKLMQSEKNLMKSIIPDEYADSTFDQLVQESLEIFIAEGEYIVSVAKKNISKHEYFGILPLFPVLKYMKEIKPSFDAILKGTSSSTRTKLNDLIHAFEQIGGKGLEGFTDSIKHNPDKQSNMPKDGTVHELTNNTMIFQEQVLQFINTAGCMLAVQENAPVGPKDEEHFKKLLAVYFSRVLGALGLNLELKARSYDQAALSALFLLNNYHYILKALQRSGMLALLLQGGLSDIELKYLNLIDDQKKLYQNGWNKVMHHLLEKEKPVSLSGKSDHGKLSQKHRQSIKDKFKGFNTEFEEIHLIQKTYAVPDEQLRDVLRSDNCNLIVPLYRALRDKYINVPFTKNLEKYVKYTPEDIEKKLLTFFDVSA